MLQFSSFSNRDLPPLEGSVRSVSPSSVVNQKTGIGYYLVRIAVTDEELEKVGGRRRLVLGMPVIIFIQKKDQTVLDYILKPLSDQIQRAFRED